MPEYRVVEGLTTGLRRDSRQNRNEQGLVQYLNLIATEWGAKQIPAITYPFSSPALSVAWPHPQLLKGDYNHILAGPTTLYQPAQLSGSLSALSFAGGATLTTSTTPWRLASFQKDIWFLANTTNFVYRIPSNITNLAAIASSAYSVATVANYGGRLCLGGLSGTLPAKLLAFFEEWKELDHAHPITIGENTDLDTNWIVYSKVGGGARDVPFLDFMSMFDEYGGNTISADLKSDMNVVIRDSLESGSIGFFPLRSEGSIRHLLPIGNGLMAYTATGVSYIEWGEGGLIEDVRSNVGIDSDCYVNGDLKQHLYIDKTGDLNIVGPRGELERLGYGEFLAIMDDDIMISLDEQERFWMICDGDEGYTYSRTGLTRTDALRATSFMSQAAGSYLGTIGIPVAEAGTPDAILRTDTFDGGFRGVHEVVYVRIAATDTIGWTVAVAWRMNKNDSFTTTSAVAFDDRGIARVKVSGIEFQLILTAADRTLADLERIEIEMRQDGKKKLRQLIA